MAEHLKLPTTWLLIACVTCMSIVPASGLVLCIGTNGHVAVEGPHATGECLSVKPDDHATEIDCDGHGEPACRVCSDGSCSDRSLDYILVGHWGRDDVSHAAVATSPCPFADDLADGRTPVAICTFHAKVPPLVGTTILLI